MFREGGRLLRDPRKLSVIACRVRKLQKRPRHGFSADGSSWERVIPILQSKKVRVVAVQNPLTSLADDVAATRKVIESQPGPVVLVGHSWGGVVITQAGNESKVAALVYVAAFAPATGQSIDSIVAPFPAPAWESHLVSDGGPLKLSPYGVRRTLRRT